MSKTQQRGATALFVVIFSALLLSVITLSFVGLINNDKRQSIDNELSQGAYDAALAGVEDAKRVIAACLSGNLTACNALESKSCQTIFDSKVINSSSPDETLIKSVAGGGEDINQAYTCVIASLDSRDVLYQITSEQGMLIPLRATGEVASVQIDWQLASDSGVSSPLDTTHNGFCGAGQLCKLNEWGNLPSLLRMQLMTPGEEIDLNDFDNTAQGISAFLYPNMLESSLSSFKQKDTPRYTSNVSSDSLKMITSCRRELSVGYACSAKVELDRPIKASSELNFLRLTALYHGASVRVSLAGTDGSTVSFKNVQPVVDSTGRANDVFRRVEARLSTLANTIQPIAAVDLTAPDGGVGSLCKNFFVTDTTSSNNSPTTPCTP